MTTKQQKIDDLRINEAYRRHCSGVVIDMLDIGKVFAAGQRAIDTGADDAALAAALVAYVNTIRRN